MWVLHSMWILRNTTSHVTFQHPTRLNKTEYLPDKSLQTKNSLITYFNNLTWNKLVMT